jgi:hypothetical protein
MQRHNTRFVLLMIVLLVSIACSLPGAASTATKAAVPGTVSPAATAVSPAAVPSGTLDLVQLYQARLKAGDWTEGQGLTQLLGMYTDPTQSTDPVGSYTLKDEELTGLLRVADRYLADNPNDQYHAAVQKQVNLLVPPLDKLELFSKKHNLSAAPHLASLNLSSNPDTPDCQDLWRNGFDSTPIPCYEYDEQTVDGTTVRLYYPSTWPAGDPRRSRLEPIKQAAARAVHIYNGYGPEPLPPVTMVITELAWMDQDTHRRDNNLHGYAVRGNSSSLSCYVGLFPSLLNFSVEEMQQGVAHEMFHCYQYRNLSAQESGPQPAAVEWWVEGSAEYFSNVVYPSANFEQRDMGELYDDVVEKNLLEWKYKAYIFFQYLENRSDVGGVPGILALLRRMPAAAGSGVAEQRAALSAYPNIGVIFQDFAQAIADRNVIDSDHNPIPLDVPLNPIEVTEPTPGNIFGRDPFAVDIHRVIFPSGFDYDVTMTVSGSSGRSSARPESTPRAWAALPNPVMAGCDTQTYFVVVTQTDPNPENIYEFRLTAASRPVVSAICDCLRGSWLLDDSTYLTHLNGIIAQAAPGTVDYTGVSGSDVVTFTQDGQLTQAINQLVVDAKMHVSGMPVQPLRISMDGTSSAGFTAVEGILTYTGYESNLTILTELNGSPLSAPNNDLAGGPLGSGASFVCSENTLTLTPKYPNYSGLPPLTFTRQP